MSAGKPERGLVFGAGVGGRGGKFGVDMSGGPYDGQGLRDSKSYEADAEISKN